MFGPLRAGAGGAGYSGRYKQGGCWFARYRAEKRGVGTWGCARDPDVVGGQVCCGSRVSRWDRGVSRCGGLVCSVCDVVWWVGGEMSVRTNLWYEGLISAGRSAKTTPLLTIPRNIFKSSARDLSLPIFGIMFLLTQYMMLTFRLSLFALHRQR